MAEIFTKNRVEWLDLMNSEHQLSFDVVKMNDNFYSNVIIPSVEVNTPFVTTRTSEYEAKYISARNKQFNDSFLITHTFNRFQGYQEKKLSFNNDTFILDLSKDFTGSFIGEGVTNAFILPFDVLPDKLVDGIRNGNLPASPLFFAVEHLMKSSNANDSDIDKKIDVIIKNFSLIELEVEDNQSYNDVVMFMKLSVANKNKINLDTLCEHFFMSRRKMQYLFEKNDTTFMKTMKKIRTMV